MEHLVWPNWDLFFSCYHSSHSVLSMMRRVMLKSLVVFFCCHGVAGTESLGCIQQLPGVDRWQQHDHQKRCTGGNGPMLHQTGTERQGAALCWLTGKGFPCRTMSHTSDCNNMLSLWNAFYTTWCFVHLNNSYVCLLPSLKLAYMSQDQRQEQ